MNVTMSRVLKMISVGAIVIPLLLFAVFVSLVWLSGCNVSDSAEDARCIAFGVERGPLAHLLWYSGAYWLGAICLVGLASILLVLASQRLWHKIS